MAKGEIPKITWGASFANTWEFGYPMDAVLAYPVPRDGSEFAMSPSGEEDSWIADTDYFLDGLVRWIPIVNGTTPSGITITGWDGATGVDAALTWLRAKNVGRFFPDRGSGTYKTFTLQAPMAGKPAQEIDATRQIALIIRATDGSAFTGY
jgi:hypothetical protein